MILWKGLLLAALFYLALCLYVFLRQREMLYHPASASEEEFSAVAASQNLERWRDASGRPLGWMTRDGDPAAPIMLLHGNAGHALNRGDLISRLRCAGAAGRIHIVDYPGYGSAPGTPTQAGLTAAAAAGLDALTSPAVVIGESLGTGVAAQVAALREEKVRSLILITPFDSMTNAAWHHYPYLPVPLLLTDRYDSVRALARFSKPVAIVIGGQDQTTPPSGARRLLESLKGPKRLWSVSEAGHNDAAFALSDQEWQALWNFATPR